MQWWFLNWFYYDFMFPVFVLLLFSYFKFTYNKGIFFPPGPDPQQSAEPRLLSLRPLLLCFWLRPDSGAPAQDSDPDQHRRVPVGRGLRQLSSARLRQRTTLQVSTQDALPSCTRTFQNLYPGDSLIKSRIIYSNGPQVQEAVQPLNKKISETCRLPWTQKSCNLAES